METGMEKKDLWGDVKLVDEADLADDLFSGVSGEMDLHLL